MNEYATSLRQSVNSWAAAFLQFETGRDREGFRSYAFVEDEDDKAFYQLALTEVDGICFLGCGGKSGVIEIYKKTNLAGTSAGNLFFVDRDTEMCPMKFKEDILRTSSYSWESHVCDPDYVGWFLARRLRPNLPVAEQEKVSGGWRASVLAFKSILDKHTALCETASSLGISLGLSSVKFAEGSIELGEKIAPGPNALSWYNDALDRAVSSGALEEAVNKRIIKYSATDSLCSVQGKALFKLLRAYVDAVKRRLARTMIGGSNSPLVWLSIMPWSDQRLEYIREYSYPRLGLAVAS